MNEQKHQTRDRRVIASMKHYYVLKVINDMGGNEDLYYSKLVELLKGKITWAHALRVLKQLDAAGLINTKKLGRVKVVEITEKGREALRCMERIMELMRPIKTSQQGDKA